MLSSHYLDIMGAAQCLLFFAQHVPCLLTRLSVPATPLAPAGVNQVMRRQPTAWLCRPHHAEG